MTLGTPGRRGVRAGMLRMLSCLGNTLHWKHWGVRVGILALPFVLFHWTLPFVGRQTIGNDYTAFAPRQQLALAFSVRMGSHPLYVPGFAGGQTAAALTLGQLYHPIAFLSRHLPGYWDGYALEWNTFLRLISLGLVHLLLLSLLRRMRLPLLLAIGLSTITVYNLRMLDLFRYGPALESWTAFLALCSGLGSMHAEPQRRRWGLLVMGATYCLVTSGHPQMAYYGVWGAALFGVLAPGWLPTERQGTVVCSLRTHVQAACYVAVGLFLTLPYAVPFCTEFLAESANRTGQPYSWALVNQGSLSDIANSFLLPLHAGVEGAFGSSPLYAAALLMPLTLLGRHAVPRSVWGAWLAVAGVLLYMAGSRTPVHYFAWRYLPFASAIRVPGRVSMLLPPLFMLLLAWLLRESCTRTDRKGSLLLPVVTALLLQVLYPLLPDTLTTQHSLLTAHSIRRISPWVDSALLVSGLGVLTSLLMSARLPKAGRLLQVCFILLGLAQTYVLLRYGTWVEPKEPTPSFNTMSAQLRYSLDYWSVPGGGLYPRTVWRHVARFPLETVLGRTYARCLTASSGDDAYRRLGLGRRPCEVVLECDALPACASGPCSPEPRASVDLQYSAYNRLKFTAESPVQAVFVLKYPWSPQWSVRVNSKRARLLRANGAMVAVVIPPGRSNLDFVFRSPATEWSMATACAVFALFLLLSALWAPTGRWRVLSQLLALLPVLWFAHWHTGLYGGRDLGTRFHWSGAVSAQEGNVAFWKPSWASSVVTPDFPHLFSSGRAVDGDSSQGCGFVTAAEREPWWIVDLGSIYLVDSVAARERLLPMHELNFRPLHVDVSPDTLSWSAIGSWDEPAGSGPLGLAVPGGHAARYLRIRASGVCKLALDEVQVFGRKVD